LHVRRTGPTNAQIIIDEKIEPCGTAFSISPVHVLTAYHNVVNGGVMCLVRSLTASTKILRNNIVFLKATPTAANKDDDWIILERDAGVFDKYSEICEDDDELPKDNSQIGVKHFPFGLVSSASTARIQVVSSIE
jgi:hypothetical protein